MHSAPIQGLPRSRQTVAPASSPPSMWEAARWTATPPRSASCSTRRPRPTTRSSGSPMGPMTTGILVCELAGHPVGAAGAAQRRGGPQRVDLAAGAVGQGVHRAPPGPALGGLLRPGAAAALQPQLNRWLVAGSSGAAAAKDRELGVASLGDGPATVRQPGQAGRSVESGGEQPATADRLLPARAVGGSGADAGEQA